jgi:nucleoid-associated protein YgaU
MRGKVLWAVLVLVTLVFTQAFGQALQDNPDYKKAVDLQAKANQAYAGGDYLAAYNYAEQAKQYAARAENYSSTLATRYRAANWLSLAKQKLTDAEGMGAKTRFPEEHKQAVENYAQAQVAFKNSQWAESIEFSKNVVAWLANVTPPPGEEPMTKAAGPVFPKYYIVRLILDDRDCFHKIAGFHWVYNDIHLWRPLYQANKNVLRQPNNPHLINPGQVFVIPSLRGEIREGTYDPAKDKQYPTLGE